MYVLHICVGVCAYECSAHGGHKRVLGYIAWICWQFWVLHHGSSALGSSIKWLCTANCWAMLFHFMPSCNLFVSYSMLLKVFSKLLYVSLRWKVFLNIHFKILFIYSFVCGRQDGRGGRRERERQRHNVRETLRDCTCIYLLCVDAFGGGGHGIPYSYVYRKLLSAQCGCAGLNSCLLQGQKVAWTIEPSF